MEVAVGAMNPLLHKLGELLVGEVTLERRVREDILFLQREMAFMHAGLRVVAEVPRPGEQVALGAREVRELSYDMEDAVDAFTVRVRGDPEPARGGLKCRVQEFLKRTARLFRDGKALHQVAGAVGDAQIRAKRLGELRQRYEMLELDTGSGTSASTDQFDPRLMAMFREATELVGVGRPRDELLNMLSNGSEKNVRTVSIVGFGGLGKTTLARAVYDSFKVQFDCAGAFVSVSRSPDIIRIFKKMLYELDEEKYAYINEAVRDAEQLIRELRRFLQDKRYIIVIDDIWDEKCWRNIKSAIPENNYSSRIITTTRIFSVSEACQYSTDHMIYKVEPLSESDSQRLFYMRIFGHLYGCPPELEQAARDILKKCGGVPLAIVSIASLLASHKQSNAKDHWYTVLNSIGHGLREGGSVEEMQTILSYSYYDLPSHLKTCLLYLSTFPEDHEIERNRLIWRWVAEDFVQHKNISGNLYDLGESYFNELINRSMIEPVGIDFEGRVQSCRVHDMVLDLLRYLSSEQNFVTIWDGTEQSTPSDIKVRRLSLQKSSTSGSATTSMLQVRSFTAFNPAVNSMPSLSQFQVLRVLDLEGCDLKKCGHFKLNHVCNLSHLRYLGLRRTYISELPVEIGKLHFLQTLDVRGAHALQELPPSISRLRKLMCLRLDWDTKLLNGLRNLTSLQELTGLRVRQDSANLVGEILGGLTGLRVLTIRWEETDLGEHLVQSLGNLREIQTFDVYVDGGRGDLIRSWVPPPSLRRFFSRGMTSHLSTLPAWVNSSSLPRLTSLDVWLVQVRQDDLEALGALPALRSLRLRATGRIGDRDTERLALGADAFPSTRACAFLHFATAPSMFPRGAMPMARRLEFSVRAWDAALGGRLRLDGDLAMGHLPSLEEISVELWYRRNDGDEEELEARGAGPPQPPDPSYQQEEEPPSTGVDSTISSPQRVNSASYIMWTWRGHETPN